MSAENYCRSYNKCLKISNTCILSHVFAFLFSVFFFFFCMHKFHMIVY